MSTNTKKEFDVKHTFRSQMGVVVGRGHDGVDS